MDLGKAKLLRTGVNALHQAIHPVHGIAWTDGKQVCLTSFGCTKGEVKFGDSNVIGQFEHVFGLSWSPTTCPGSPALLAVQHKKHITVWQLQLSALEQNKLLCTQTCEMSEPFPLLSQGCVWHPHLDILAVLTKRDTSVLFSVRVDNRRVKADIKGSGLIHCACWTKDGTRLVVAVGSTLQSYIWNDVQKSLVACSFCPVFDVGGYICAIQPTGQAQVAVATELPLDKICGLNAGMAFELPMEAEQLRTRGSHSVASDDDSSVDSRRRSFDSDRSGMSPGPGPIDLTHILERHRRSDPNPLVHLRRRDNMTGSGQDSSHLILVTYERKVTTTRKVNIPGILVPDIIAFDPRGSTMAVASNTCNMVLVYCVTASSMPNIQQISLQKNERPKGVCFLNNKTLLLIVGRQKSMDPAFLQSSNTDKYMLRIMVKELFDGETPVTKNASSAHSLETAPDTGIRRHSDHHLPKDDREILGIKDLVLPGGGVVRSPGSGRRLVEQVSDPSPVANSKHTSDQRSITVDNFTMDQGGRMTCRTVAGQASRDSSRSNSPRFEPANRLRAEVTPPPSDKTSAANERSLEQLVQTMERLFGRCAEVQQCLTEMRDYTQNGRKPQGVYPNASEPPYVNVTCQRQLSENVFIDERRPVLLCEGKLCLRVLQDLFDLTIVEMMYGPLWVVLVADADGFVPLTFKAKEELMVRNGKRKAALRTPGSPEDSRTPSPTRSSTSPNVNVQPNTSPEPSST